MLKRLRRLFESISSGLFVASVIALANGQASYTNIAFFITSIISMSICVIIP